MKYYLGIDGGGSKTNFIIVDGIGQICNYISKPSCYYLSIGLDKMKEVIQQGIEEILEASQINLTEINYAFLGIPAYGEIQEDENEIHNRIQKILTATPFTIGNDVEVGFAGSLSGDSGINIVSGTGSICFAQNEQDSFLRIGGWGEIIGDDGSSFWIGCKLLNLFSKMSDNRIEKSALYEIVKTHCAIERELDLIKIIYSLELSERRTRIAQFSKICYESALQGDPNAITIFQQAGKQLSLHVISALNSLNFQSKKIKVSYSGSVFKAGEFILNPFRKELEAFSNKLDIIPPQLEPICGAAILAMKKDNIKINLEIVKNLKQINLKA